METSHGLQRELRLRDLVLMQVILIVSPTWTGFAAKQGSSHIVLWLVAIALFYIPLALVVMKLSREIPAEGGVYQWVRQGVSPFAGYMAGWCLAIFAISLYASLGSTLAGGFAYAAGPSGAFLNTSKPFALGLTAVACVVAYLVNSRGLHLARWFSGVGALLIIATLLIMVFLLFKAHPTVSLAVPGATLLTVNVFTKMAVSALSGFDQCAVFSEECRKPENDVAKSVLIAAPLIAILYILGTSAVLAWTPADKVDLAAPVSQVMQAGFGVAGLGRILTGLSVQVFNIAYSTSMIVYVGMVARLPMVAGWDGVLPAWWSELHPRYRTPTKAIAAVTIAIVLLGILSLWGADNQEASQVTAAVGIGSYCVTYMLLFGSVCLGFRKSPVRFPIWLRIGSFVAFAVSLAALIFELAPVGDVADLKLFALKVGAAILCANGAGALLYYKRSSLAS